MVNLNIREPLMCWVRSFDRRGFFPCGRASPPIMHVLVHIQSSPSSFWSRWICCIESMFSSFQALLEVCEWLTSEVRWHSSHSWFEAHHQLRGLLSISTSSSIVISCKKEMSWWEYSRSHCIPVSSHRSLKHFWHEGFITHHIFTKLAFLKRMNVAWNAQLYMEEKSVWDWIFPFFLT